MKASSLRLITLFILSLCASSAISAEQQGNVIKPAPLFSIASHDAFFSSLKALCGKAFLGKVTLDNHGPSSMSENPLIMHVRRSTDQQLQTPFHVGDDASRT